MVLTFEGVHFECFGNVYFEVLSCAAIAEGLVTASGTVDAGTLNFDELAEHVVFVDFRDVPVLGVVPCE